LASKKKNKGHWMPLGLNDVVFLTTQSMIIRKRMGEIIHLCLTPDFIGNHSGNALSRMILHSMARVWTITDLPKTLYTFFQFE
jgi:hypothetical protein